MSDNNLIGHGSCPVCGNAKARFTVSKKLLACMTCNACNIQIFARSDSSDEKLRAFIKPAAPVVEDTPTPAPAPAPKAEPAPAAPAPAPAPAPQKPATEKPAPSWGIGFKWSNG